MSRTIAVALAGSLSLFAAAKAQAQSKVIEGSHVTATATVEAVEQASRRMTFRDSKGELHTVTVPESVTRFSEIKPGDTITATYYDNITLRAKAPGEPDVDTLTGAITPGESPKPVGTVGAQRTITAVVDAIDMDVPSISFKGPRGWQYNTKVQDREDLKQVKVGDRVDIVWTEAVLVSVTPPKL